MKFILKASFEKNLLHDSKENFFSFYNLEFSENFLMKNILDDIFKKKYFIKKSIKTTNKGEPDYYIRHNNRIFLFENKDILINKTIKASKDITKIDSVLSKKLLKPMGINQLVNSIEDIINNRFMYDDLANKKNNFEIYPILILTDNILEIPGANYKLNNWYIQLLKERFQDKYSNKIKNLTLIDINTLIFWTDYFKNKDRNFRDILKTHFKKMKGDNKNRPRNENEGNKAVLSQFSPISLRLPYYVETSKTLINKYRNLLD